MRNARGSVVVAALSAVGLLTGLAGAAASPAAAPWLARAAVSPNVGAKTVRGLHEFQSPSGNIGCDIAKRYARCDIKSRTWKPPPPPANCHLDYGQGLYVARHGKGGLVCAGDTALDPQAPKLAYGHSIRDGVMRCKSRTTGMTCKNRKNGHGFFLSKETYRAF